MTTVYKNKALYSSVLLYLIVNIIPKDKYTCNYVIKKAIYEAKISQILDYKSFISLKIIIT